MSEKEYSIKYDMKTVDTVPVTPKGGKPSRYDALITEFINSEHPNVELTFPEVEEKETIADKRKRAQGIRNAIKKRIDVRELQITVSYSGTKVYLTKTEG